MNGYDDYGKLLDLGGQNADLDSQMKSQQAMAELLRSMNPTPGGRGTGRGYQMAPTWLESLAHTGANIYGMKMQGDVNKLAGQKTANTNEQNRALMQMLMGNRAAPAPEPGGTGFMPPQRKPGYFGDQ